MEEIQEYNRIVRLSPMTYYEALQIAYKLLDEKAKQLDREDLNNQGLSMDYKSAQLLLANMFLVGEDNIIK